MFCESLVVKVLVTVTVWVKTPELLLVKRPRGLEHRSTWAEVSKVHSRRSPETPLPLDAKPAPVRLIDAGLTRLLPSLGETLMVMFGLPKGAVSGAAMAAPIVPTVMAMAMAKAARWRGTRRFMRTTDLCGCGAKPPWGRSSFL